MPAPRRLVASAMAATVSVACTSLTGCHTAPSTQPAPAAARETSSPIARHADAPRPATSAASAAAPRSPTADPVRLVAIKVNEWPLSDFGLSVKTNFEVVQGENVRWMEVSGVDAGGPAAAAGFSPGDRILAIDGVLVTTLTRDGLLDALFKRKSGDRVRLLVARRNEALPRFVQLVARRP